MKLLPEPFDVIEPRMVGRLEAEFELGVVRQPSLGQATFMDTEIIENTGFKGSDPLNRS